MWSRKGDTFIDLVATDGAAGRLSVTLGRLALRSVKFPGWKVATFSSTRGSSAGALRRDPVQPQLYVAVGDSCQISPMQRYDTGAPTARSRWVVAELERFQTDPASWWDSAD